MKFTCFSAGVITVALSLLVNGAKAKLPPGVAKRARQLKEKKHANKEFMKAMNGNKRILEAKNKAQAERRDRMYEKLLSGARKLDNDEDNDGQDSYSNAYWNDYEVVDPGFDLSDFAFKYAGCAAIKEYDMDTASENGNAMTSATYAVFRLCPADSCNKYSITGCGKNYGEYVVEMETYLEAMMTYYDDRYEEYCMYCLPCDDYAQEDYASWLQSCYAAKNEAEYETEQETADAAYQEYYEMNNGDMSGYNVSASTNGNNGYNGNNGNRKMAYSSSSNYNNNNNNNDQNDKYAGYDEDNAANYNWNAANYNWRASQKYGDRDYGGDGGDGDAEDAYYQIYQERDVYYQEWANDAANDAYGEDSQYSSTQNGNYNAYKNNYNNNNNNYNQNANQNQKFYGYYNANGQWVQPDEDEAMESGWGYWTNGVWYPYGEEDYESEKDECFLQFAEFDQCDEYVCGDYVTYCTDWYGDQETQRANAFNLGDYTECTEYEGADGQSYYVAPHCGSNHFTIKLGVYSDESCVNYIGDTVSIATVLGYQASGTELNYFPKECISCDGAVSFALFRSIICSF
jgi:hypothetical protein